MSVTGTRVPLRRTLSGGVGGEAESSPPCIMDLIDSSGCGRTRRDGSDGKAYKKNGEKREEVTA
jgi:hypothetical protein